MTNSKRSAERACRHVSVDGTLHFFRWPDAENRNIWNPLHPVCLNCGKSIGELLGIYAASARLAASKRRKR